MEVILIVAICLVPIVALFLILPKKLKKKSVPKQEEKHDEYKPVTEIAKKEPKIEAKRPMESREFAPNDFRSYLLERGNKMTKPSRLDLPEGYIDRTEDYVPVRRRRRVAKKPENIAEEIRSLSPELKALIMSGALIENKRDNKNATD